MAKGTNSFTAVAGDARAMARCAPRESTRAVVEMRPSKGASMAAWLAYHETQTPGGEFNALFAELDAAANA